MMQQEQTMRFCPQCGTQVQPGAKFCGSCGATLSGEGNRPGTDFGQKASSTVDSWLGKVKTFLTQPDYIPNEAAEDGFIESNVSYYRQKFYEMRTLKQPVSFNLAALLCGVLWMLYRKMYVVAAAELAISLVANCLGGLGSVASLALVACNTLFGNYLYMMTVQKRVTDWNGYDEPARSEYLNKYKGTSNAAVVIGLVLVALCALPALLILGLSTYSEIYY